MGFRVWGLGLLGEGLWLRALGFTSFGVWGCLGELLATQVDNRVHLRTVLNLKTTICRNVKRFRGGLLFKAHRRLYHSTLRLRVIKKEKKLWEGALGRCLRHELMIECTLHSVSRTRPCTRASRLSLYTSILVYWVIYDAG